MTAAEWGKTMLTVGVMIIITAAIIYWIWPDWMAQRAVAGRLGSLLIMGGGGAFISVLGAFVAANNAH